MDYYKNNEVIKLTTETLNLRYSPFYKDGTIWEHDSLIHFFNKIPKNKNKNVVDIGAQIGLYTLYAKFLPNTTFYSFEPFEKSFRILNENIKLNDIQNVKTFNIAVSDKESDNTILNVCTNHSGLNTLGELPLRFDNPEQVIIKTITLDTFFKDIPIDFIKIDTEGYEYFILKGGIQIIKKYKPIIQLEWNIVNMKQCNVTEQMLDNIIEEIGYVKTNLTNEELIIEPKSDLNYYLSNINKFKHVKIDIGLSYSAPCSQSWLSKEEDLLVIGFEPNPECINSILSKNITKRNQSHDEPIENKYINNSFFLIPVALSNVNEPTTMYLYGMENDCGCSSLFQPINLGPIKEVYKVPVYSLKHFFDSFPWNQIEYIDYVKINTQGSDLDILKGAGEYIRNIAYIRASTESNSYINCGHNTLDNMINYLEKYDFILINHQNTTFINKKYLHLKNKIYIL